MAILLIEDEKKVANFITKGLTEEGYEIDVASDGEKGLELAVTGEYEGIILDLMLPRRDGISLLRELRARGDTTPVLVLTAKGTIQDRVIGLDSGADDYLPKPFHFEELTARIRSLLRRSSVEKSTQLQIGDLVLDTVSHRAKRGDEEIELTAREYALLEYLMRNSDRVLSRSVITQHVWNYNFDIESNLVDVYINRLRNKIELKEMPKLIHSIRGVGYIMRQESDDDVEETDLSSDESGEA
jgi:heavy metal response regulator